VLSHRYPISSSAMRSFFDAWPAPPLAKFLKLLAGNGKTKPIPGFNRDQNFDVKCMWHDIANAPFDRDLELAVIDVSGVRAIAFACRRVVGGWIKAETQRRIDLRPTHWREWAKDT